MATQTVYFNNPQDITNLQASTTVLQSTTTSMSGSVSSLQASTTVLQSTTTSMSGSVSSLQTTVSTQVLPTVVVTNNNFTAQAGYKYLWVPTGTLGAVNVTLPSSPVSGDTIQIADGGSILGGAFGLLTTNYTGTTITTAKAIVGDIAVSANSSTAGLWPFRSAVLTLIYDGSSNNWKSQSNNVNQHLIVGNPSGNIPIPTISGINPLTGRNTFGNTPAQNAAYPQTNVPNYVSLYAEPPVIAQQSEYVQANLHVGDLCDCNTLQVRSEIYSDYNKTLAIRGGISIEPGSDEQTAQGLDGGFTFTDATSKVGQQYKTQIIDGVMATRKMLPRSIKPTVSDTNIIININDGGGAATFWLGKVCADSVIKHKLFRYDLTGASYDYFCLGLDGNGDPIRPTSLSQFKLPCETTADFYLNYQPVGSEHVYQSSYPEPNSYWAPMETDRHKMYDSVVPPEGALPSVFTASGITYGQANTQNTVAFIDSANSAQGMATGRLTAQNVLANVSFSNPNFDSYGAITRVSGSSVVNPLTTGNQFTTYGAAQTITELCKSYGKATCVATTCNFLHATPAAFGTKSQHRQFYAQSARYMFSPINGAVRPDLVVGALPNFEGVDYVGKGVLTSTTGTFNPNKLVPATSDNYYFPEITSAWATIPTGAAVKDSGAPLLTAAQIAGRYCRVDQYAQYYGYNVYSNFASATGTYNGQLAKVLVLLNNCDASPGFVSGTVKYGITGCLGSSFCSSTGAGFRVAEFYRDYNQSSTRLNRQKDIIAGCKRILASQTQALGNKGYFMMYENAETDWGGHTDDALQAGFDLLECSLGMYQSYFTGTASSTKDLVISTVDHEVGGWTFGTTGANPNMITTQTTESGQSVIACPTGCQWLDINDSMNVSPTGFWYRYTEYEQYRKVALGLNFIATTLSFAFTDGSQASYTLSNTPATYNANNGAISVALATGSYNATNPLSGNYKFNTLDGYQGTGGSSTSNYRDWFAQNVSADQSTGPLIDYLPCHVISSAGDFKLKCRIKADPAVPGKVILMQSAFDQARYNTTPLGSTSTGTVPTNFLTSIDFANDKLIIFAPASILGRWFVENNPFGSDAANDQFMTDLLQANYASELLFKVISNGNIVDSDSVVPKIMLDKYTNDALGGGKFGNGFLAFGSSYQPSDALPLDGIACSLHRRTIADLCSYYDPVDGKVTVFAQVGATLDKSTAPAIWHQVAANYHSLSTSALWAKCPPSYANYDISVSGGALAMKDFLNEKTVTQAGIRKLMDGTI